MSPGSSKAQQNGEVLRHAVSLNSKKGRLPTTPSARLFRGPLVAESAAHEIGRRRTSVVHELVHAYRREQGFFPPPGEAWRYPAGYLEQANRVGKLLSSLPKDLKSLIESLSSPQGYKQVRQAGRMRASARRVDEQHLNELAIEVRAALLTDVARNGNPERVPAKFFAAAARLGICS